MDKKCAWCQKKFKGNKKAIYCSTSCRCYAFKKRREPIIKQLIAGHNVLMADNIVLKNVSNNVLKNEMTDAIKNVIDIQNNDNNDLKNVPNNVIKVKNDKYIFHQYCSYCHTECLENEMYRGVFCNTILYCPDCASRKNLQRFISNKKYII